ncbi:MAG: ATP-binding protein [Oscillatoriales cyanobacterium]|nr:MAG: ATP-binding protein [Oscillatoriales cyanobacterium]TAH27001.1 MAG: ATP-binding protein [Oscillatoriales cyanobacterium]
MNLADTKTRLLGCSAVMAVGQVISNAIADPGVKVAAGIMGGPIALIGVSILATIAGSTAENLAANDLGNRMTQKLAKNPNILDNHDLTKAAGEAIGYIFQKVAKSPKLKVIALSRNLPSPEQAFNELAEKTPGYWLGINTKTADLSTGLQISEEQLTKIFSADVEEFDLATGLTPEDWAIFINEFARCEGKSFDPEIVEFAANQLYTTFPQAYREVLKLDAEKGGQKFAAMLFNLHQIALAELKDLGLQNGEILQRLEAVATQQQICQLMAKLEVIETVRDELAEVRALLQTYIDISAPSLPLSLQCETIIQDRVKDFTGRLFVFEAISRFLRDNRQGYFVLEAEPGVGKSAIMAKLVLTMERHCVTHFNSRSDGIIDAKTFLENACTQLIQGFQLKDKYPQLPDNATANGNFLGRLLGEVSAKVAPKKLIFVVDALDEVDLTSQSSGSNVLYLPEVLPDHVYFIVSKRREFLPMPVNHLVFDLMKYNAESLADVKAYLAKRTEKSASIQSWINHRNLNQEEFVEAVADKSEKKFIYLRYVLDEIESGTYRDVSLNDLPVGLQQYYKKHWGQMMGRDDDPLLEMKVKIIYVLSKAREAVSRGWIAKSVAETDFKVQQVLRKWDSFLRQQQVDGEIRYSIYHNSFRDFLEKDETVQSAGINVEEVKRKGINNRIEGAPL